MADSDAVDTDPLMQWMRILGMDYVTRDRFLCRFSVSDVPPGFLGTTALSLGGEAKGPLALRLACGLPAGQALCCHAPNLCIPCALVTKTPRRCGKGSFGPLPCSTV